MMEKMTEGYNGKVCGGSCKSNSPETQFEYDFEKGKYVCRECGHEPVLEE